MIRRPPEEAWLSIDRVGATMRVNLDPTWDEGERMVRVLTAARALCIASAAVLPADDAFIAHASAQPVRAAAADLRLALDATVVALVKLNDAGGAFGAARVLA